MNNFAPPIQNPHEDRITSILQQRAQPQQFSPEEISGYGAAAAIRGDSLSKLLEAVRAPQLAAQDRELEGAKGMYDMFEQARARGDKQAQGIHDQISKITSDPMAQAKLIEAMGNDQDQITPQNALMKAARYTKELGIQPDYVMAKQKADLEMQKTRAEIGKLNRSASEDRKFTAQETKQLLEQEDVVGGSSDAIGILDRMENLNKLPTYEGIAASQRAIAGSVAGDEAANNTLEINNLGKELAASMLKSTFVGAISNAEREFLEEVQASGNKTAAVRQRIINKGKSLISNRIKRAQQKQERIQTGSYKTEVTPTTIPQLGGGGVLPVENPVPNMDGVKFLGWEP